MEKKFGVSSTVLPPSATPSHYFNAGRERYQAKQLLDMLFLRLPVNAQRIIGIIEGDLEYLAGGENRPCDGYAELYHRAAIYSVPNVMDRPHDQSDEQTYNEVLSEHVSIHEFGHTLGISHCVQPNCMMNPDIDLSMSICSLCRKWADRELNVRLGSAEDRFSLAESFFRHNCLPQAIALYREAIYLAPREPLYYHSLYVALTMLEQPEEANRARVLATAYSDDSNGFYYTCGLSQLRNEPKEAEENFTKALAVAKNPQKMRRLIGQAYREIRHNVELANEHYQEYLRLGGNDQDIANWLISRDRLY